MSIRARGAQEIRTHAAVQGSCSHSNERHVIQFQLAALELERTRRNREKEAALRRVRDIDRMLLEIEEIMRRNHEILGLSVPEGITPAEMPATKRQVLRY
jgi:hypothetical protein